MSVWTIIENGSVVGVFEFESPPEPEQYPPTWSFANVGLNPDGIQNGWTASKGKGGEWSFGPFVPPPPTAEEIYRLNFSEQSLRATQAATKIAPLICEIELPADDGEAIGQLKQWIEYYKTLQIVDLTGENTNWPVMPE